jgi:hypothetical protein
MIAGLILPRQRASQVKDLNSSQSAGTMQRFMKVILGRSERVFNGPLMGQIPITSDLMPRRVFKYNSVEPNKSRGSAVMLLFFSPGCTLKTRNSRGSRNSQSDSQKAGDRNTFALGKPVVNGTGTRSDGGARTKSAIDHQEQSER